MTKPRLNPDKVYIPGDTKQEKLIGLDYLRALACILVLVIHTTSIYLVAPSREAYRLLFAGMNTFAGSAVAVFIFISGLSLTLGYKERKLAYIPFIKRRLQRIGGPFIFWSLFYLVVINRGLWINYGPLSIVGTLLGFSMYHLYYMVIIIQLYLIYPFLLKLHKKLPYWWVTLVFFFLGIWCEKKGLQIGPWSVSDRFGFTYGGYFSLGIMAGLRNEAWQRWLKQWRIGLAFAWVAVGTVASLQVFRQFSPWYSDWPILGGYRYLIFALVTIFFSYSFVEWFAVFLGRNLGQSADYAHQVLKSVSKKSLDIYLVHPFFLAAIDQIWARLPQIDSLVRFSITFLVVGVASYLFAMLKERLLSPKL